MFVHITYNNTIMIIVNIDGGESVCVHNLCSIIKLYWVVCTISQHYQVLLFQATSMHSQGRCKTFLNAGSILYWLAAIQIFSELPYNIQVVIFLVSNATSLLV